MPRLASPLWRFDRDHRDGLEGWMAGIDEAGRGPLAGPVVAAAVIFFKGTELHGLNDSKKLTASAREKLFFPILRQALVGIGIVSEEEIDRVNIYQASRLAMRQAVLALPHTPARLLIDGPMKLDLPLEQRAIIKGDQKSASIAAASIVAKVYRDRLMTELDSIYPCYGFAEHKGYATPVHQAAIRKLGPCAIHRKSFDYIRELCGEYSALYYRLKDEAVTISNRGTFVAWESRVRAAKPGLSVMENKKIQLKLRRLWKRIA